MTGSKTEKTNQLLSGYFRLTTSLIIIFFTIRILEYSYIFANSNERISIGLFFSKSLTFDILLISFFALLALPVYMLIGIFHIRTANILTISLALILILANVGLTHYFLTNNSLLTSVLFDFSLKEISEIVSAEFSLHRLLFWIGDIAVIAFSGYLLFFRKPRKPLSGKWKIISAVFLLTLFVIGIANRNHSFKSVVHFKTNYQFLLGNSKILYFAHSFQLKESEKEEGSSYPHAEVEVTATRFQSARPEFQFVSQEYPFLHNEDYANPLGNYFPKDTIKPNIVIVISESLSASYSGKTNSAGSLTYFTDSLAAHSLVWNNFFSNAERTYGALPNILASLPSGLTERGFINLDVEYPERRKYPIHESLITLLKEKGYQSLYFYGGQAYFDNIGQYISENQADIIVTEEKFDNGKFPQKKESSGGFVWGYDDKSLFRQSFDYLDKIHTRAPYLAIYQTLTAHSPFNNSDYEYYSADYISKRIEKLGISPDSINRFPDGMLPCVFFADDALRELFSKLSTRADFRNTIFIITGDHAIDLNLSTSEFENYRIPLIIYSPMLKESKSFFGICSHIDILPSLLGLLENNFGFRFPAEKHWIGEGLDTSSVFSATRFVPLSIYSIELPNFICGNYVEYGNEAFRIDSTLHLIPESDNHRISVGRQMYQDYKYLNRYGCLKDRIFPKQTKPISSVQLCESAVFSVKQNIISPRNTKKAPSDTEFFKLLCS
ncbi:MAG: LTA synthase family protein [Bacteroidetes bacterium]|nr:LTA synthase family protein [Bacteroidota bacterium]MBU1717506.1 LTA synthase family protein [Bacteroidota bacterium]